MVGVLVVLCSPCGFPVALLCGLQLDCLGLLIVIVFLHLWFLGLDV